MTIPSKSEEITLGGDSELRFEIESKECITVEVSSTGNGRTLLSLRLLTLK